ncbi:MAG: HNH endonuclease, partial [Mycolicibacterium sp.]
PGWGREAHASTDLTADHVEEVALGGDPHGPLQTLCRSCNARKNATRQNRVR